MNATRLLERQHREIEELFERIVGGQCDVRQLRDELCNKLLAHMLIEQVVLFPEVQMLEPALIGEAGEEHAVARFEIRRLYRTGPGDPSFLPRVTTLKELIEHHVEEEECELLPRIDAFLPVEVNERLGKEMSDLYDTLVGRSRWVGNSRFTSSDASV